MKKTIVAAFLLLGSCAQGAALPAVDPQNYTWDKVVEQSKGQSVSIYMWGGSEAVNRYMDEIVTPRLKELNGITLRRVPVADIKDTVNKLIVEKRAGKTNGSADILWINGENFKLLKESGGLWGGFSPGLPALALVKASALDFDFGTPVEGLEAPWGEAQFNLIHRGKRPFYDAQSLKDYVQKNPGRFTYPAPPDFTGSAFVRNLALELLGPSAADMTPEEFRMALEPVWEYFRALGPYLWKQGESYPESIGKLDLLYQSGEIDTSMGYQPSKAAEKITAGEFPSNSQSFLLDGGTLFNNHYLSIPWNASHRAGALTVINYLLGEEAQKNKQDPKIWGDGTILDLDLLSPQSRANFERLAEGPGVLSPAELKSKRRPEPSPQRLELIEEGWMENIYRR